MKVVDEIANVKRNGQDKPDFDVTIEAVEIEDAE
jgi:hypothetical protein